MRILILTQWFNPEPNFKGLAFAKELQRLGHEVEILTGFPNYPGGKLYPGYRVRLVQREEMEGVPVMRVALYPSHDQSAIRRAANYLSFAFTAAILGPWLVRKADVMYVYHPPATVGLPAIVISALRRIPFVYDIQDLWPDTLAATGMLRSPLILRAIGLWCRLVYRRASRIAVLSGGFKTRLETLGVPAAKIEVIHNWCDESLLSRGELSDEERAWLRDRFNVLFAGNMGKAQGLDVVLRAAERLVSTHPEVRFVMVGAGVEMPRLKQEAESRALTNVAFLPARPSSQIGGLLRAADVLLVHLKADPLFEITIPSKIQAYLSAGRPILIGGEGDAVEMVAAAKAGLSFKPGDAAGLAEAVASLHGLRADERGALGRNGAAYYEKNLAIGVGARRFAALFESVRRDGNSVSSQCRSCDKEP